MMIILITLLVAIPPFAFTMWRLREHPRGLYILFFAEMWERFSYYGMRGILIFYLTWHFLFESDFSLTLYGAYVALVYLGPLLGGWLADRYILFFAEMWERFSYYGMRGILIFYLTWHFLFESDFSLTLYGAYVALVYLGPLLGGWLADRYIGFRKAVTFGAILLVAGHGLMSFHGEPAKETLVVDGASYALERPEYSEARERFIVIDGAEISVTRFEQPTIGSAERTVAYELGGETVTLEGTLERERSPLHETILFAALALIVAGVGFLKPNIST
ncbi:MAG: hypothetical protein AAFO57_09155, partial [Pseudomonadota bacterium]